MRLNAMKSRDGVVRIHHFVPANSDEDLLRIRNCEPFHGFRRLGWYSCINSEVVASAPQMLRRLVKLNNSD